MVPQSDEENFLSHEYLDQYVGMDKSAVMVDEIGKNFTTGRFRDTEMNSTWLWKMKDFSVSVRPRENALPGLEISNSIPGRMVTQDGFPS